MAAYQSTLHKNQINRTIGECVWPPTVLYTIQIQGIYWKNSVAAERIPIHFLIRDECDALSDVDFVKSAGQENDEKMK